MKVKGPKGKAILLIVILIIVLCGELMYVFKNRNYENIGEVFYDENMNTNRDSKIYDSGLYGVSSSNALATEVGMKVLQQGGNAVDAAIAVSYTLSVVEPYGSGIGGGGGMLIHNSKYNTSTFLNYREYAPYSKKYKENDIGVPGFVKGMEEASKKYGTLPIEKLIQPAIDYAEGGFEVDSNLHYRLDVASYSMEVSRLKHFYPDGLAIEEGDKLIQKELAQTLIAIQKNGSVAFYNGELSQYVSDASGIKLEDIQNYEVTEQKPVIDKWKKYNIITAPPPFSGITLIQFLKLSDKLSIPDPKKDIEGYINKLCEIKKVAYKDRFDNIGDPLVNNMQHENLASDQYVDSLYNKISNTNLEVQEDEHESTTHFVVIDKDGMIVSCTNTMSNFFGSRTYTSGFFLNSTLSGLNNNSSSLNCYEPGKRPRTYTCPTIITDNSNLLMGIGSAGGTRIPQVVNQVLLGYFRNNQDIKDSITSPRYILEENTVYTEERLTPNVKNVLEAKGYNVVYKKENFFYGSVQALLLKKDEKKIYGGADFRRQGVYQTKN